MDMDILAAIKEMLSSLFSWGIYALAHPEFQHQHAQVPYVMNIVNEIIRFHPSVADRGR